MGGPSRAGVRWPAGVSGDGGVRPPASDPQATRRCDERRQPRSADHVADRGRARHRGSGRSRGTRLARRWRRDAARHAVREVGLPVGPHGRRDDDHREPERQAGAPPRSAVVIAVDESCHRTLQRGILDGRSARGRGHGANASGRRRKASCIELDSRCIDVDGFCRWARCAGTIGTCGSGGISGALRARHRSRVREEGVARGVRAGRRHQPRRTLRCALCDRRRHDHAVEHDGSSLGRGGGRRRRIKQAGGRTR